MDNVIEINWLDLEKLAHSQGRCFFKDGRILGNGQAEFEGQLYSVPPITFTTVLDSSKSAN